MIFGLFKKVTPEKLIDHASGLFDDKNNFKVYFDDFNENYIDDNEESYEIFQRNWKAIIYTIVKGVYQRFGSNKINQYEYMQIIAGLLGKIVDINNPNPDDKKLFDQYEYDLEVYRIRHHPKIHCGQTTHRTRIQTVDFPLKQY